jgi:lysophospholipase L1-like esterase
VRRLLTLVILPVLLALSLAEIYVRVSQEPLDLMALTGRRIVSNPMSTWARTDAFSAYRARPGAYGVASGEMPKTVNSEGYISTPEISREKPAGVVRLAFFGGSSTAGTGPVIKDSDTWPLLTVELLREALPGVELDFLNAALAGYSSFESYGRLWSRVRFFDPDVLVVYHGWNDLRYFCDAALAARWRVPDDGSSWAIDLPQRTVALSPKSIDPLIAWSQVLSRLRLLAEAPVGEGYVPAPESSPCGRRKPGSNDLASDFDPRALEVWRDNLRLFESAALALDAELYVVKQATLIVPSSPAEFRDRNRYEFHGFDHDAHVRAFEGIYAAIDQELPPQSVLDATPLSGREELFFDHIHLTPVGTRALAGIVASELEDRSATLGSKAASARSAPPHGGAAEALAATSGTAVQVPAPLECNGG